MSNRKTARGRLKKIYKNKKKEDALVGRKIEALTKFWLAADKSYEVKDGKIAIKTNIDAEEALIQLREIRAEPRFREDFPSFAKFSSFVKNYKVTVEDLLSDVEE